MPVSTPLPDRIIAVLPSFADAPTVSQMAARLQMDHPRVRAVYDVLEAEGRARIVRRGRGLHLVPADYAGRICPVCRVEFAGRGRTCSKSCGLRVAWRSRDRARQGDVLRAARKNDPEKFATFKSLRDNPAHRQFVADRNRKDWADPVKKMERVVAMEAAWQGAGAEGRRSKARNKKLALWDDADWRQRTIDAMRTGKRGRFQRAVIQLLKDEPLIADEGIAARTRRSLEQTKVLMRRLFRLGLIGRAPVDGRKRKQPAAIVSHRVEATKRTKLANRTISAQQGRTA